jgi:hypothetical protein
MNSDNMKDHGVTDRLSGQEKKPWVTPSLQIIALKNAENGSHRLAPDSVGSHLSRPKS